MVEEGTYVRISHLPSGKEYQGTIDKIGEKRFLLKTEKSEVQLPASWLDPDNEDIVVEKFDHAAGIVEATPEEPKPAPMPVPKEETPRQSPAPPKVAPGPVHIDKPAAYLRFCEQVNTAKLPAPQLEFVTKKTTIASDEDSRQVDKHLLALKNKLSGIIKNPSNPAAAEKMREIHRTLMQLQSNYYFDDDIRNNMAYAALQLQDYEAGIQGLKDISFLDARPLFCHALSYFYYELDDYANAARYWAKYISSEQRLLTEANLQTLVGVVGQGGDAEVLRNFLTEPLEHTGFSEPEIWRYALAYLLEKHRMPAEFSEVLQPENGRPDGPAHWATYLDKLLNKQPASPSAVPALPADTLTANAQITQYFSTYGFLTFYESPKRQFASEFRRPELMDDDIFFRIQKGEKNIHVFCAVTDGLNAKSIKRAVAIHSPNASPDEVAEAAKAYLDKQDYDAALAIAMEILKQFPEHVAGLHMRRVAENALLEKKAELIRKAPPPPKPATKARSAKQYASHLDQVYAEANNHRVNKRNEEALKLFAEVIEGKGTKMEAAVKDSALVLQEEREFEAAIDLLTSHLPVMANKEKVYNLMASIYGSARDYHSVIEILKKILDLPPKKGDKRVRDMGIKKRMASCYIQLQDYPRAERLLNEILKYAPDDQVVKKWLDSLEEAKSSGSYAVVENLSRDSEFSILTGRFSALISSALDRCLFEGLTAVQKAKGSFDSTTLEAIRSTIDKAGRGRPRERAGYLLTEAKLMEEVEQEKEYERRSVLARYSNAMAVSHAEMPDVMRTYYLEGFSLETNWDSMINNAGTYLYSYIMSGEELILKVLGKRLFINRVLSDIFEDVPPRGFWDGILQMFIANTTITARVLEKVLQNPVVRHSASDYLKGIGIDSSHDDNERLIKDHWNKAREKRRGEFEMWFGQIQHLAQSASLQMMAEQFGKILSDCRRPWLSLTDIQRLDHIRHNIFEPLRDYTLQTGYDDKERLHGSTKIAIEKTIEEIAEMPTRFSFEGFLPLLESALKLLTDDFDEVKEAGTPRLALNLLGDCGVDGNNVDIQVSIANDKQCSPVSNIRLEVKNTSEYSMAGEPAFTPETLRGGESIIMKLNIRVSPEIIRTQVADVLFVCTYDTRNADKGVVIESGQTLNLYDKKSFEDIPNPYRPFAGGKMVDDDNMFKGREEVINAITASIMASKTTKCVVLYGQKRSGKTSVLYHLELRLNETGNVFCVRFSLGEILLDLNIATFCYWILSNLKENLEDLKEMDQIVPDLEIPNLQALNDTGIILFHECLKKFQRSCKILPDWKDRKLVLLIDEFTYIYTSILKKAISDDFMKAWKALFEKNFFSAVLVGQDVMPKFKDAFANEFGPTEDRRLTYLSKEAAKELIEMPVWDHKRNQSRFIGDAVERILEYTSENPYYIQHFCARLVEHLNKQRAPIATEYYVKEVAESFIKGNQAFTKDKFDNLLTAGDADLEEIKPEDSIEILKQIAHATRHLRKCPRDAIRFFDQDYANRILDDLTKRDVLAIEEGGYRIQVELFKEWLLIR